MFFTKKPKNNIIQSDESEIKEIETENTETKEIETKKVEIKSESEIRNIAMELFLNFGDCSRELTNVKLKDILPGISNEDARQYYEYSRQVREDIYKISEKVYLKEIDEQHAKQIIHTIYPFISDKNCMQLCSRGLYSAWQKYNKE